MSNKYISDIRLIDSYNSNIDDNFEVKTPISKSKELKLRTSKITLYMENINCLPIEMIDEIAKRIDIDSIVAFCRSDTRFFKRCKDKNFWIRYISGHPDNQGYLDSPDPQERLHELLIELAKQGEPNLFQFLWETPLSSRIRGSNDKIVDTTLVKEIRSLTMSYEVAYMNNKQGTADKIWSNNKYDIESYYSVMGYKNYEKVRRDFEIELKLAALSNNLENYLKIHKRVVITFSRWDARDMVYHSMAIDDFSKDMFKLLAEFFGGDIDLGSLATDLLTAGRVEFVELMVKEGLVGGENVTWPQIINSSRPDSFELLQIKRPDIIKLTPQIMDHYFLRLGDPMMLLNYAKDYPEDHDTILRSASTLSAKQFLSLYKKTAKSVTKDELEEYTNFWMKEGRTYLIKLFKEQFPISG